MGVVIKVEAFKGVSSSHVKRFEMNRLTIPVHDLLFCEGLLKALGVLVRDVEGLAGAWGSANPESGSVVNRGRWFNSVFNEGSDLSVVAECKTRVFLERLVFLATGEELHDLAEAVILFQLSWLSSLDKLRGVFTRRLSKTESGILLRGLRLLLAMVGDPTGEGLEGVSLGDVVAARRSVGEGGEPKVMDDATSSIGRV